MIDSSVDALIDSSARRSLMYELIDSSVSSPTMPWSVRRSVRPLIDSFVAHLAESPIRSPNYSGFGSWVPSLI